MDAIPVVERYVDDVLNGRNEAAVDDLISNETFKQRVTGLRVAFPDLRVTTNVSVAQGDLVAVSLTGRGTHQGLFQGCPATGRVWTATCSAIYRVEDGRISDFWVNWDLLAMLEQLGCVRRIATVSA